MYINKLVNGKRFDFPVDDAQVKSATKRTFDYNRSILDKIKSEMPDGKYTEGERLAMFSMLTRHVHYTIEDVVTEKIINGELLVPKN